MNQKQHFLDTYIHSESKFLSDGEIASRFIEYTKNSKYKHDYERVISSSSMKMSHEVYRRPDGKAKLCAVYTFDSLGAFLYFDFFRGLSQSYTPKRCRNTMTSARLTRCGWPTTALTKRTMPAT